MGDVVSAAENALAQPYRTDIAVLAERQDDAAFGIGEVDELRVRAQLLHVAREVEDHRQGPHRKEQSAGPTVLAERVTNAVLLRNFVVELPEPIAVDRRRIEDEACTCQRGTTIDCVLDAQSGSGFLVEKTSKLRHARQAPGIGVDQCEGAAFEILCKADVPEHAQPKRHAPSADEDDFCRI